MDSNPDVDLPSEMGDRMLRSEHMARYESSLARAAYHLDRAATAALLTGSEGAYKELSKMQMELRQRLEDSVDERYRIRSRSATSDASASSRPSARRRTPPASAS